MHALLDSWEPVIYGTEQAKWEPDECYAGKVMRNAFCIDTGQLF